MELVKNYAEEEDMTEREILWVMTIMNLLAKPVSVQKVQETYRKQQQILAEANNATGSAPDKSSYEQIGVRIIGIGTDH